MSSERTRPKLVDPEPGRSAPAGRGRVRDRFLGCLLGGAVGDALGAPIEFDDLAAIRRKYGPDGLTDFAPVHGGLGRITDDTQMTLFTAEGLLRGWVRGSFRGITSYPGSTARAYLRWLRTQGESPRREIESESLESGWLFQQRELHSRRAPGQTCLTALRATRSPGEPARNDSKGCGGVMRVAPAGLFAWRLDEAPQRTFRLGADLAALTHGHPTGALTGGVLACLIQSLIDGTPLSGALDVARSCLRAESDHEETLRAIDRAEASAASAASRDEAIRRLGQGWVAEEALAISIYCALVARTFEEAVVLAVNHDGDSDSTGAITGNLVGAMHGVGAIPERWLAPLELRGVIAEIAGDLHDFREWDIGESSADEETNDRIWRKYPGD